MAQTGYTPILIYASGTATNVPLAANLTSSANGAELALNYTDGKLYYKDNAGVVQLLASKAGASGSVTSVDVSGGTTGLTTSGGPVTSSGTITLAGTLSPVNGGTGVSNNLAATVTSSGNFAYTRTLTGVTNVTFPTTGTLSTLAGSETLTNKRINPRVSSTTSAASITPDISAFDQYCLTAQAAALTINAPTGTPVDGNKLIIRILDNGTARTLTWNATYTAIGVTIPTSTTVSKMTYVGCIYNAANTRWDVIAVVTQS